MKKIIYQLTFGTIILIILLCIWFGNRLMIGATESELTFYNALVHFNKYNHVWSPVGLGFAPGTPLSSITFNLFQIFLQQLHMPDYMIQAVVFGLLLMIPFFSMYFYARSILKTTSFLALLPPLFYTFNLVALGSIWNRLQYPYMFFYALLPLSILLFIKGLQQENLFYALGVNIATAIFVMGVASVPTAELYWAILSCITLFFIAMNWKQKGIKAKALLFLALNILIWLLFNSWWLLETVKVLSSSYVVNQRYAPSIDVSTFISISMAQGNLSYIFRLMNQTLFTQMRGIWGNVYVNPFIVVISYAIPFLAFLPLIFKKRPKFIYPFLGISLFLTFFMKGSNGPFGFITLYFFSIFRFLEAFRNPFEKASFALPFFYALPIGYSFLVLFDFLKRNIGKRKAEVVIGIFCFLMFGVLVFPMWNKWVFTNIFVPTNNVKIGYFVKVPGYYKAANDWLNSDKNNFRFIILPMTQKGDGITQNWQVGFNGTDPSNDYLFNTPSLSFSNGAQFADDITKQLEYSLINEPEEFSTQMSVLSTKYLMIRSDINYKDRTMRNPGMLNNFLSSNPISGISFEKKIGMLDFYRNNNQFSKIYPANNLFSSQIGDNLGDLLELTDFTTNDAIINNLTGSHIGNLSIVHTIIDPVNTFSYTSDPNITLSKGEEHIPYARFLPGSLLYPLIHTKEVLELRLQGNNDSRFLMLILLTEKRLGEVQELAAGTSANAFSKAIQGYIQSIHALDTFIVKDHRQTLEGNKQYLTEYIADEQLVLQNLIHNSTSNQYIKQLKNASSVLRDFSIKTNISSSFDPLPEITRDRSVYDFENIESGDYEMLLRDDNFLTYYQIPNNSAAVQVNNQLDNISLDSKKGNWIDLGSFQLTSGKNEIQLKTPKPVNLINSSDSSGVIISKDNSQSSKIIHVNNFSPYAQYRISFDYKVTKGSEFSLAVQTDVNYSFQPDWKTTVLASYYNRDWETASFEYNPGLGASMANFIITAKPFNDCHIQNPDNTGHDCTDKDIYKGYNKYTSIVYRNLRIERIFTNPIVLRKDMHAADNSSSLPEITFKKINSSEYQVSVKKAEKPYLLVFSEAYNPLWQAKIEKEKSIPQSDHYLVNSYANAWYITKSGNYSVTLYFQPEDYYKIGSIITLIACGISLVTILLWGVYRKNKKNMI